MTARFGTFRDAGAGYRIYAPVVLADLPDIDLQSVMSDLSKADLALGRLDGVAKFIPNPDLFVEMYIRKEAVLSSQIEGTQASLDDILEYEAGAISKDQTVPNDVDEVFNHVNAMNYGLARLDQLPLSNRLLREIHEKLLVGVRGEKKTPGQFRRTQNWIGPPGRPIEESIFVPPPPNELGSLLGDLEQFIQSDTSLPILIRCAIAHCRFETIHPFLDGNGRLGRLLITLMLCEREILHRPLLYLSAYLKKHRQTYYECLMGVRENNDMESWLRFFLRGVHEVADQAYQTADKIIAHRQEHAQILDTKARESANTGRFLDLLYRQPIVNVEMVRRGIEVSQPTANSLVAEFESLGILGEITGRKRDRVFRFHSYMGLFTD